ncbi:ATP-binding cassette domain-containing protein [Lutimonas saemankumensis]|uniref:peptidase domain-containing ABC transporter n=1 Tax=Lutimonas saemankumensis TaxID=483016 RepID=UPI001CD535C0|nr:ATP-binding cassette domain-containing protein [Lutimonas saemankumensis]MCA0931569.1 ATP-binding cassette domain-containing protein [Lutimonas saemankumensis]
MEKILSPWQRLIRLLELERKSISQIFYYAIFSGLVGLSLPLGIQAIINLIQGAQISSSWIVLVSLVTIGVLFTGALQLMQMRIIESLQRRIFTRASFELSYRFPKIKLDELRNSYPPELANRFFDTLSIQKGLAKILVDVPTALLQILFALILLSFYHPFFIIFGILLLLLVYTLFKFTAKKGLVTSLEESKIKYKVAHWIQETARTLISFKVSGRTSLALQKNDLLVTEYLDARDRHFKVLVLQFIQMIGFKVIVTAVLLIIGGILVLQQEMNIGQFVAAEIIILIVISSVEKLILGLEPLYDLITSTEKLGQVVDKELETQKGEKPDFSSEFSIELTNLTYAVKDKKSPILSDLNLTLNQKSRILAHGESGSGKSTLLKLISGLVEPSAGNMNVNGFSIHGMNLNHYRSNLGIVLTEETPFEGTLRENLTFGSNEIDDKEILKVIKEVNLVEFLKEQNNGLNTIIHPEGKQIPSSISKKILLARAILKKPKLLILENLIEPFNPADKQYIVSMLTDSSKPWGLIVADKDPLWKKYCHTHLTLQNGHFKNLKHA